MWRRALHRLRGRWFGEAGGSCRAGAQGVRGDKAALGGEVGCIVTCCWTCLFPVSRNKGHRRAGGPERLDGSEHARGAGARPAGRAAPCGRPAACGAPCRPRVPEFRGQPRPAATWQVGWSPEGAPRELPRPRRRPGPCAKPPAAEAAQGGSSGRAEGAVRLGPDGFGVTGGQGRRPKCLSSPSPAAPCPAALRGCGDAAGGQTRP